MTTTPSPELDLSLAPQSLRNACARVAAELALAGRAYADALERELRADERVVTLRARLYIDTRHRLERSRPLARISEKEVEAALHHDPEFCAAKEAALVATVERVRRDNEREAIRTRRDMLIALTSAPGNDR